MAQDWRTYLLRYGEIGIKSRQVRRQFEGQLVRNLESHFEAAGATALIDREWGRIWLDTPDHEVARHAISRTFGLVSGSPTHVTEADIPAIQSVIRELAPDHVGPEDSFAIRARRTGTHPFTSQDVGAQGGAAVLEVVPEATVDLDEPDVEIHVEVRNADAYVFTEIIQGPGGLPAGSQGTVVVPFLGPRSPAAAWLVMRRGAKVHPLVPEGCRPMVELMAGWAPGWRYTVVPGEPTREALLAAADELVDRLGAHAVALDDHETRALTPLDLKAPILRPLAGLPGKRWPRPAYRLSKQAAKDHPAPCVTKDGMGEAATIQVLSKEHEVRL